MKNLLIIFFVCLSVASYGQRKKTFYNVTVLDSLIYTDTTIVVNAPEQDTATVARTVVPLDTLTADMVDADSVIGLAGYKDALDNLIKPPHTWARFADSSVTIAVTQNVYAQVTNPEDSLFRVLEQVAIDWSGDTVIVLNKGHFIIDVILGIEGTVNDKFFARINTTDGEISKFGISTTGNGVIIALPLKAYWDADVGDKAWIEITNTSSGDDPVITEGIFIVTYFHPIP
jgi:hypothetical protein